MQAIFLGDIHLAITLIREYEFREEALRVVKPEVRLLVTEDLMQLCFFVIKLSRIVVLHQNLGLVCPGLVLERIDLE